MAIRQDIGIVTAYGYAVSKGYTGTEEEFAQAMANAGITLDSITDAVDQFLNTTVPAAVQTVQNEGGTQVTNVQSAGTAQITAVNEAGTTQIGNVNTAGANQISAIQTKGEETIESIPSDYTELSDSVEDLKNAIATINDGDYAFKIIPDVYINTGTGNQQAYSGWSASDFVPLTISRYTKITCVSTIAYSVVYDENKTKIRQFPLAQGDNYLTAENGAYIRFSDDSAKVAKAKGLKTLALTGEKESKLSEVCDISIKVPETETYKVQELHLPVYHYICYELEKEFFEE